MPISTLTRIYLLAVLLRVYHWLDDEPTPDAQGSNVNDVSQEPEYPSRMLTHVSETMEIECIAMEDRGESDEIYSLLNYWTPLADRYMKEPIK